MKSGVWKHDSFMGASASQVRVNNLDESVIRLVVLAPTYEERVDIADALALWRPYWAEMYTVTHGDLSWGVADVCNRLANDCDVPFLVEDLSFAYVIAVDIERSSPTLESTAMYWLAPRRDMPAIKAIVCGHPSHKQCHTNASIIPFRRSRDAVCIWSRIHSMTLEHVAWMVECGFSRTEFATFITQWIDNRRQSYA
jgi:hypothetical protein